MWGVISKPVRAKCMEKQQKSNFLEKNLGTVSRSKNSVAFTCFYLSEYDENWVALNWT